MIDRITNDDDGRIDEVVARNAYVHLERLDKNLWMLIITCGKQYIHLNVRGVFEYERCTRHKIPKPK